MLNSWFMLIEVWCYCRLLAVVHVSRILPYANNEVFTKASCKQGRDSSRTPASYLDK